MQKMMLRVLISASLLGLLFYLMRDQMPAVIQALKNVHKPLFAWSMVIYLLTIFILAKRLQLIFAAEEVKIKLSDTANLTFIGFFFNNFLPTSVGGDIVKAMCAARVTGHPVKSVTSIVMDRIFGLFTFIVIPSLTFLFVATEIQSSKVPMVIYSFLAFSILSFFLLFNRRFAQRFRFIGRLLRIFHIEEKAAQIYKGLHDFKRHRLVAVQAMALSLVGQAISIFSLYLMAMALGATADPIYFYLLVPVVHLISMVPSLNGLGVREWAYIIILKNYIGVHAAAALGILYLGLLFLMSVIGGLIYLFRHDYHVRFGQVKQAAT